MKLSCCQTTLLALALVAVVVIVVYYWRKHESFDMTIGNKLYKGPPYHSLLGGFGSPVNNFNAIPQMVQYGEHPYNPAYIADQYLETANRSRINNMM